MCLLPKNDSIDCGSRTVSLLRSQDDHLSPDLDQSPVSKQVGYAETNDSYEDYGESLHGIAVLGITRAVWQTGLITGV
jgi:hypothetical protein